MPLTQEQRDFFCANGYLPYGRLLEDAELEPLQCEYDRLFEEAMEADTYRNLAVDRTASPDERKAAETRMLQIMQVCERSLVFRRLIYDTRILDVIESLLGPNIMLYHDQALFKPALTGGAVYWHQDNAYWQLAPANLVSCWITLDEASRENGAMQVIPGSHLRPIGHDVSENTDSLLDVEREIDTRDAVVVPLPAGGCMFHHCQTLHYTAPNTTQQERRAFAIHFMTPGTRDRKGEVLRVGFDRPMLRMCI